MTKQVIALLSMAGPELKLAVQILPQGWAGHQAYCLPGSAWQEAGDRNWRRELNLDSLIGATVIFIPLQGQHEKWGMAWMRSGGDLPPQ